MKFKKKTDQEKFLDWAKNYAEKRSAGSAKSYLNVIIKYLQYILDLKDDHETFAIVQSFKNKIHETQKYLKRKQKENFNYDDLGDDVPPEDVKKYDYSEVANNYLANIINNDITKKVFTLVRSCLFLKIALINCPRAGVITEITLKKFLKMPLMMKLMELDIIQF